MNAKVLRHVGLCLVHPEIVHGPPASVGVIPWAQRLFTTARLLEKVQDVDGDLVECGVYYGYGLLLLLAMKELTLKRPRHIWGFDSFRGHPNPSAEDRSTKDSLAVPRLGNLFTVREEDVWLTLRLATGRSQDELRTHISLVPGWFSETLPEFNKPIAFLHFDGDLYQSAMSVFENLWPHVSAGGIVHIGNADDTRFPGKGRATEEFFEPKVQRGEAEFGRIAIGAAPHTYVRKCRHC